MKTKRYQHEPYDHEERRRVIQLVQGETVQGVAITCGFRGNLDKQVADDLVHAANTLPTLTAEIARLRKGLESLLYKYCRPGHGHKKDCQCAGCLQNARIDAILGVHHELNQILERANS